MILHEVFRVVSGEHATIGVWYRRSAQGRHAVCWTLEDRIRDTKRPGITAIPPGRYPLALRTAGPHHERYAVRFGALHQGMVELVGVPGFRDILVHCGNTDQDTQGCILVGEAADLADRGSVARSEAAYRRLYPELAAAILSGDVSLRITHVDTPVPVDD